MDFECYKDISKFFILSISYKSDTFEYSEDYSIRREDLEKFKKVYEDPEYYTNFYIYDKHLSDNFVEIRIRRNYINFYNINYTTYSVKDRGDIRIYNEDDVTRCLETVINALETYSESD